MRDREIDKAIEIFVRGFCFTRSLTHPYVAERVDGIWVTRDAPRQRKSDHYRNEEWIAHGVAPAEMNRVARANTRGRFAICMIRGMDEEEWPIRAEFKRLNYRLGRTEPLMLHRLKKIPRFDSPASIERVTSEELAAKFAKATKRRPIPAKLLEDDAPFRQYVALDARGNPIGWVRSIVTGDSTWVGDLFVQRNHRRKGIGRALMARMLRDDREYGSKRSALLASHTGAMLYPIVGYEQIGELLLYTPKKR